LSAGIDVHRAFSISAFETIVSAKCATHLQHGGPIAVGNALAAKLIPKKEFFKQQIFDSDLSYVFKR
jgi:hypothetical protein